MSTPTPTLRTRPVPTAPGGYNFDGATPGGADGPCACCGRPVTKPGAWIHMIDGGRTMLYRDDEPLYQSDGGDLGLQPVGSDCTRLIPKEYRYQ